MISEDEFVRAKNHLFDAKCRLNCHPDCNVFINGRMFMAFGIDPLTENELRCTLDEELLAKIVRREEHWNNAELGCHIMFERKGPYMPDVHTLLCFFHA